MHQQEIATLSRMLMESTPHPPLYIALVVMALTQAISTRTQAAAKLLVLLGIMAPLAPNQPKQVAIQF